MTPPPLPLMHEGTIDAPTLEALFADVEATGALLAVVVKRGRMAEPPRGPSALAEAREALRAGTASAVQLRYRHEGREWWDTVLTAGPGAWRIVRIAHEA
jgi:hypothetical protein